MTAEVLRGRPELRERETRREGHVVYGRPELVGCVCVQRRAAELAVSGGVHCALHG